MLAERRDQIAGRIAFVFQPADEPQTGAKRMIGDGLLDKVKPDVILAQHTMDIPVGKVVAQAGAIWGSIDVLNLTITGQSSVFGSPETGFDPVLTASEVVSALYALMHREAPPREPVVFRIGTVHSEATFGATEAKAELTMRLATYNKQLQQTLVKRIEEVVSGIVTAHGGTFTMENTHSIPPIVNDPEVAQVVIDVAKQVVGEKNIVQNWINYFPDDLGDFLEAAPGCLFLMGTQNAERGITGGQHRPNYDIDEECLPTGVEIMCRSALELLR